MKSKNNLGYRIYSKKNIEIAETKTKLLGVNSKVNAIDLLNERLLLTVASFALILYFVDFGYLIAPLVAFLIYQLYFPH